MIISNISFEKKKFHILFDCGEEIEISEETLIEFGLYKGQEVEDEIIDKLKFEDEKTEALLLSYRFLQRNKTEKQLIDYLYKNKISGEIIDTVIPILNEKKYLNDEDYARRYLNDAMNIKKYGKIKIIYMLRSKGIKNDIIEKIMRDYDYELEYLNAEDLLSKKLDAEEKDPKKINSAKKYLQGRGFEFEIINFAVDEFLGGDLNV
ncbi:MAG: RecX family transcriptional regulator [Peptoniphilus grossensis]|uniref:RecX family transcriptional regulator n=1 Tax=Peptoniphilus grossensis TaxID=1465756 RepID=UPI0025888DAE|nr:RecX family transcriptional regulator [Peptoniphilus grossensis]MDU5099861.1 RecX family transcriptional regulator [Peptoniphilus grossensis]